jgi:hypothetical protein
MIKRLSVIVALIVVLVIPTMAAAWGWHFGKSLCDFPFGDYGSFSVYYDQRIYHPDYYTESYPNGGIKIELWLGLFETVEARDDLVNQIYWVRYTNKSTGSTYLVKTADKYLYLGDPSGEYSIWNGHISMVVGNWVVVVVTKRGRYKGSFTITREMVEQFPAIAVDPFVYETPEGGIEIVAHHTNGGHYRARIFDNEGNIDSQKNWWPPEECDDPAFPCPMTFEYPAATGERLRIETRIYDQAWPLMVPDDYCIAYGMNPGAMSRSLIWLKLEPLPPPP